uniref:Uncharacterized protein n=1 Tax=Cercocebus atys TaxID=9531 RepID=A0A2K5KIH7_CERAT
MEDKTQQDSRKPRLSEKGACMDHPDQPLRRRQRPRKSQGFPSLYCKATARPRQKPGSLRPSAELVPHRLFPVTLTSSVLIEHKLHTRLYAMPASAQGAPSGSG